MATKPPIFHPYTTNTGQVFLSDLVLYPRSSVLFTYSSEGTGVPVAPIQITADDVGEGLVLLVYSDVPVVVGYSADVIPVVPSPATPQLGTIILAAEQYHLLQWPSQYFTPIPISVISDASSLIVNILWPQNSAGDAYKLENR